MAGRTVGATGNNQDVGTVGHENQSPICRDTMDNQKSNEKHTGHRENLVAEALFMDGLS